MATINLSVKLSQDGSIAHRIRYARIDNVLNLSWITVSPDVVNSPNLTQTIATNIPSGQYRIGYYALYSDLRTCSEQFIDTSPCDSLISINAYLDGANLIVQYLAPSDAPKVRITVNYPNGGSYTANYVNNGNDIPIALPGGVYGDFTVTGQSVCDESSGFYSPPSSQVTVTRSQTTVLVSNQTSLLTVTGVSGLTGYTLSGAVPPSGSDNGTHSAFTGQITLTLTSTGAFTGNNVNLILNGTLIQCVDITSGTVIFNSASFAATDEIQIILSIGSCI
jgi:hypothetical protein